MANTPTQQAFIEFAQGDNDIIEQIAAATNWQDKYRHIMLQGKAMPKMDSNFKQDAALVRGCESKAWLHHCEINGFHYFIADSDARIVKGLTAVLLLACQGKDTQEIQSLDLDVYFTQLGLNGQLSPSRTNGLLALVQAIKNYAS